MSNSRTEKEANTAAESCSGTTEKDVEDTCSSDDGIKQQEYLRFVDFIQKFGLNSFENNEQQESLYSEIIGALERSPYLVTYQIPSTGQSALMVAAASGNIRVIELLLQRGAVWNALDRLGKCAGNYAVDSGHQEAVNILVEAAVRAELLLGATVRCQLQQQKQTNEKLPKSTDEDISLDMAQPFKPEYLSQAVRYNSNETALLDEDNDAVMMDWEKPLMSIHASIICQRQTDQNYAYSEEEQPLRILNVGFGMGIIDEEIQKYKPSHHAIIEAHPSVYERMKAQKWDQRAIVHFGKWQQVVPKLLQAGLKFDGIFFDTYGEHWLDMEDFHVHVAQLLEKPHGVYSFFNGLAPDNVFFHGVACECIKLQLSSIGLDVQFEPCEIEVKESEWDGIRRKYWHGNTYYLPICVWKK